MADKHLAKLDRAMAALAEARTFDEVKKIKDVAEAARVYAKAAHMGRDAEYRAAEVSLLAAHKAGTILKELPRGKPKAKGGRVRAEYWRTLSESGTPYRTAQRWQAVADKDESVLEKYFASARKQDHDISTAGFLRAVKPPKHKPKSPYERHISIPLTELEYVSITRWARNSFYPDDNLKSEQRFARNVLAQFFEVVGLDHHLGMGRGPTFKEKSDLAPRILKWLAQEPISKSPLFKEVMEQYGVTDAEIREAHGEKERQGRAIRQTGFGPMED